jgi:hypothetical protein
MNEKSNDPIVAELAGIRQSLTGLQETLAELVAELRAGNRLRRSEREAANQPRSPTLDSWEKGRREMFDPSRVPPKKPPWPSQGAIVPTPSAKVETQSSDAGFEQEQEEVREDDQPDTSGA